MVKPVDLTVPASADAFDVAAAFQGLCDRSNEMSEEKFMATVEALEPWLVPDIIDFLVAKIAGFGKEREPAISLLTKLDAAFVRRKLPDILQPVINMCTDTSKKVRELSLKCLEHLVQTNGNSDLDRVIPGLVQALKDPNHTVQAIDDLASCVFVQDVEAPALAVIMPIIRRGLRHKQTEIQRKSCVILDNVCRLVDDPKELSIAIPEILPLVKYCAENISKPEAREVANRALKTILDHYDEKLVLRKWSVEEVTAMIKKHGEPTEHIVKCTKNLCDAYHFEKKDWERVYGQKHAELCAKVLNDCEILASPNTIIFEDTEEGQDLYKGEFSLAYGTLTLLRKTRLHLKRNRFYGLLGPNNCGKTTLMRAIDHEQIEGFPKKTELKTLFVEHEIEEREVGEDETGYPIFNTDLSGTDWVVDYCNNVVKVLPAITTEAAAAAMGEMGFGKDRAADADMPVTTYSGGWKVKMQLVAAKLINTDLLMLDEPTGHLDVTNIAWLKGWLKSFLAGGGSIITTSHDSEFLQEMCTHVIDFQKKKLVTMKGNLNDFVAKFPEKKSYFVLTNEKVRFVFPEPGPLEGVKSLSKHILKMTGVTFQYPARNKPTVMDICLEVSRVSRVAVIGPNGAGKSTAIKLLIGE
jgi:elongation factor 3